MKTKQVQYLFSPNADNTWTIIELTDTGPLNYECEFESYHEAVRWVKWMRAFEKRYNPPRK